MNPSEFKFYCPRCAGSISASPEWEGLASNCPHCGEEIQVPRGSPATVEVTAPPLRRSFLVWLKARKAFAITIALVFAVFAGALIHSRSELKRVQKEAPSSSYEVDRPYDPFVLGNGYRIQNLRLEERGSDGRVHVLTNSEEYQAFMRAEEDYRMKHPAPVQEDEASICSTCNGTGKNRSTSVSSCAACSGGGTRLTPSGHRMVCNGCEGTGIARQDPNCIYCQGTGRVGLPGQ